jgi:aquaporin Z
MFSRRRVAALVAEFLGTGTLAFVVLTISRSQIGIPYFVAIAAGMVVAGIGVALQRDVHLNPALTIGAWTARRIPTVKAVLYVVAQLLGGLAAYSLFKYFSRGTVQASPTTYDSHILVAEAVGTFIFAFIASAVSYQKLHPLVRQLGSGLGFTIGVFVASAASLAFINPAIALANNTWAWSTYVLGPVLGAIIGVNLYGLLFAPREEKAMAKTSTASVKSAAVIEHVKEDKKAVPADRLAKVEKAEKSAKADKSRKSSKKSKK